MPQPPKPPQLKLLSGTFRPCRDGSKPSVTFPSLSDVPPAPDWLPNGHAVKEWNRLAPILVANKLLSEGGLSALASLCALHGKIVQLYAAGECPTSALIGQYRAFGNDFGLTPIAASKIRYVGNQSTHNPFARNGSRMRGTFKRGEVGWRRGREYQ